MKFKGKTAYFSHTKSLYGTKDEKFVLGELERILKGIVICPNRDIGNFKGYEFYDEMVSKLDKISGCNFEIYVKRCTGFWDDRYLSWFDHNACKYGWRSG